MRVYLSILTLVVWFNFYINPILSYFKCDKYIIGYAYIVSIFAIMFIVFLGFVIFRDRKISNAWAWWYSFMATTTLWEIVKYSGKIFKFEWKFLRPSEEYYDLQWQIYFCTSILFAIFLIIKRNKIKNPLKWLRKQKD